jgi:signal transduction histidine kinase
LRERLQRAINRLMYGERDTPYTVISRLGQRLEVTLAPEAILSIIVETVAQALKLPYAAISLKSIAATNSVLASEAEMQVSALKQDEEFAIAASYVAKTGGVSLTDAQLPRPETLLHLPLLYQSEQVGELLLAPRARGESFTPADRRLLDDLARQVGIAAHAVQLTAALQQSRERLVTAREEERRRLRRDLHDGLGPTLAALNLQAGAVRTLIPQDPAEATVLVTEWRTTLRAVIADIRRLVYDLRPPALDELGLIGAIREQSAQYSTQAGTNGVLMVVEMPDRLPPLPAAVEVAAYRIALEALTNVARHAQARTCHVRLWLDDALRLEVTDDGIGLSEEHRAGVGMLSMRERAEELGGSCRIEPALPRGTRVYARLPLPKE